VTKSVFCTGIYNLNFLLHILYSQSNMRTRMIVLHCVNQRILQYILVPQQCVVNFPLEICACYITFGIKMADEIYEKQIRNIL